MNIFRDILKELPLSKIEIIHDDPKDKEYADQMNSIINWKIVKSKSDIHPECGYPMGEVLCRNLEEANEYVKESEFKDCYIVDYMN